MNLLMKLYQCNYYGKFDISTLDNMLIGEFNNLYDWLIKTKKEEYKNIEKIKAKRK